MTLDKESHDKEVRMAPNLHISRDSIWKNMSHCEKMSITGFSLSGWKNRKNAWKKKDILYGSHWPHTECMLSILLIKMIDLDWSSRTLISDMIGLFFRIMSLSDCGPVSYWMCQWDTVAMMAPFITYLISNWQVI